MPQPLKDRGLDVQRVYIILTSLAMSKIDFSMGFVTILCDFFVSSISITYFVEEKTKRLRCEVDDHHTKFAFACNGTHVVY